MFRVEDRVFVLAGCVDDLGEEGLGFVDDFVGEGVFDGGVVGLDEVPLAVLDRQGGFADGAGADDGDLALLGMRSHCGAWVSGEGDGIGIGNRA